MQVAIAKRAFEDDPHCGDQGSCWQTEGKIILCIVDGLGHGEYAERAAKAAVDYIAHHLAEPLPNLFAGCNLALRHTRGVAMGIAVIDEDTGMLTYAGIGNPRATIVRGARPAVRLGNNYGIIGGGYRKLSPKTMLLMPGDLVILTTDGIPEGIDLSGYDDALHKDIEQLAERILHDWGRETDDAAVLVFRSGD